MKRKIEEYWWFPYVAWSILIIFTIMVTLLTLELRETAMSIEESSLNLENRIRAVEDMLID